MAGKHIFLSYAREDGSEFACRLYEDLQKKGHEPWLDVSHSKAGNAWTEDIEKAIDSCDILLAILTRDYINSKSCRVEHMRALRIGKTVIPLLLDYGADRPLQLEHLNYQDFTDVTQYVTGFRTLLNALDGGSLLPLPEKFQSTLVIAPPLPPGYVPRPEELERLRSAVIGSAGDRHVALTALQGMGGVGKTVLAMALCYDPVVQAAFPDGIVWTTIGRTPGSLVPQMQSVGTAFGDGPEHYPTLETSATRLKRLLRKKAALLVLDDVWDRRHVEPFLTNEVRCRTLFTSRDPTIALNLGATEVRLGTFTPDQAVHVLREWTGSSDPLLSEIAECCRYLGLALRLAGARMKGGTEPSEWLRLFRSSPSLLQMEQGYRTQSAQDDLITCFDLSLNPYQPAQRRLYFALGIFPEDLRVAFPVVCRLWRQLDANLDENRCRGLLADFARMELLDLDGSGAIALHDLLQEYASTKLDKETSSISSRFLDSYVNSRKQWWGAPNDGYFFRHAAHHFVTSDRSGELERLLLDFRWLQAKLANTEPDALIEDFDALPKSTERALVQSAIRLSAHVLIQDRNQLAAHLTGRLLGHPSPAISRLVSDAARHTEHAWLRPLAPDLRRADGALVQTLRGHTAGVSTVILLPDEVIAISASFDSTIKLWDWRRGIELKTLAGHARQVNALAITPDGQFLISGSSDCKVKVWDIKSGTVVATFPSGDFPVVKVEVTADGSRVVASLLNEQAYVWDLKNKTLIEQTAANLSNPRQDFAVTPDSRREVRISSASLEVWDRSANALINTLPGHPSYVYSVAITNDGRYAITGHDDHRLRIWDLNVSEPPLGATLEQRPALVAMLPGGRRTATTSVDGCLRIWKRQRSQPLRKLLRAPDPIVSLRSSLSGLTLVAVTWDLRLRTVDPLLGLTIPSLFQVWGSLLARMADFAHYGKHMVSTAATSAASLRIIFSSREPTWSALNLITGRIKTSRSKHRSAITALAISANGRYVVSGSEDGSVKLWRSWTRRELLTLDGHASGVSGVAVSANGKYVVSAGFADHTLKVWDTTTRREIAAFTPDSAVQSCSISLLGRTVAVTDVAGGIHYLRLETGR
ncbi:MAG TPA: TIR domain-containing protein [Candidatus Dormibacteraeota bacterium]|nr:TIR domain-containing protein [Candidatus Dormibacteraeota bacterium]